MPNQKQPPEKLFMPPVTVPFKWLVICMTMAGSGLVSGVSAFMWAGATSATVAAHDRDIMRNRDTLDNLVPKVGRIEGILESAFPTAARDNPPSKFREPSIDSK